MKKIIALVLSLVMVFALAACGNSGSAAGSEAAETPVPATIEECVAALESVTEDKFDKHCEVSLDGLVVSINFWIDGITSGVGLAMNGDAESLDSWNRLVESAKSMCDSSRALLDANGHNDYAVLVQVVSDLDTTKAFLSVADGVVLYDAINGVDVISD